MRRRFAFGLTALWFCAASSCGDRTNDTHRVAMGEKVRSPLPGRPASSGPDDSTVPGLIALRGDDVAVAPVIDVNTRAHAAFDSLELFGIGGLRITVAARRDSGVCARFDYATVQLHREWSIALPAGVAEPLRLDSIGAMGRRDSLTLSIAVARLASRAPGDTDAALHGLPYIVRSAWTFDGDSGRRELFAVAQRTLALEADPRSEVVLVVADVPPGGRDWTLQSSSRDGGSESSVSMPELRGAFRINSSAALMVFVEQEVNDVPVLAMFERHGSTAWTRRWTRPVPTCR